ncbi:hypothetical protein HMPREF9120_00728 [Neisseria sp. oral taxon 020 str. F0370]|nr:hypothetical protein HMPREF9120_00728 [Neisseria sp. oral taxon 020 str. F0370]
MTAYLVQPLLKKRTGFAGRAQQPFQTACGARRHSTAECGGRLRPFPPAEWRF